MPQVLERMMKIRNTLKIRKDSPVPSQRNVFGQAKQRMDNVSSRIQQRKPQFLSQANETLGSWQPGSRITKIMPVDFGKKQSTKKKVKELDFSMSVQAP